MKLFKVNYIQIDESGDYLTIGKESDTKTTIVNREKSKETWRDDDLVYLGATEIKEIEGHTVHVD